MISLCDLTRIDVLFLLVKDASIGNVTHIEYIGHVRSSAFCVWVWCEQLICHPTLQEMF